MNPIHIPKPYFPKIHLNVVLPSTPRYAELEAAKKMNEWINKERVIA
jgi:hypothetical protein